MLGHRRPAVTRRAATKTPLGEIDAASVQRLMTAAGDVALVLDDHGVIQDVVLGSADVPKAHVSGWIGRPWVDTVTVESRAKVEALLADAGLEAPRWRQVNHPAQGATDWPVLYSAVRLSASGRAKAGGRVVAFGRDLRAVEALQQRLIEAQQSMERDYWRFRQAETRYRHLFQLSNEALLIVDAGTLKVMEANPAASALIGNGNGARKLVGLPMPSMFDPRSVRSVQAAIEAVRAARKAEPVRADLADGGGRVSALLTSFRQDDASLLLMRLTRLRADAPVAASSEKHTMLADFVQNAPDAMVFTDAEGRIRSANNAFVTLAQLGSEEQARGELLDRWLGRTGVELGVLIQNLRQRGSVRLFATLLRGEDGATAEVEVSATATQQGDDAVLAFAVRDIGRRLNVETRAPGDLPRSASELTELVGRVPLKDIVGETTDLIEQLCIETALQMTSDNRASAAQMLGLSRQSLYVKLRRYGLGELGADAES